MKQSRRSSGIHQPLSPPAASSPSSAPAASTALPASPNAAIARIVSSSAAVPSSASPPSSSPVSSPPAPRNLPYPFLLSPSLSQRRLVSQSSASPKAIQRRSSHASSHSQSRSESRLQRDSSDSAAEVSDGEADVDSEAEDSGAEMAGSGRVHSLARLAGARTSSFDMADKRQQLHLSHTEKAPQAYTLLAAAGGGQQAVACIAFHTITAFRLLDCRKQRARSLLSIAKSSQACYPRPTRCRPPHRCGLHSPPPRLLPPFTPPSSTHCCYPTAPASS